jgi:hypothetical protein
MRPAINKTKLPSAPRGEMSELSENAVLYPPHGGCSSWPMPKRNHKANEPDFGRLPVRGCVLHWYSTWHPNPNSGSWLMRTNARRHTATKPRKEHSTTPPAGIHGSERTLRLYHGQEAERGCSPSLYTRAGSTTSNPTARPCDW